MEFRWNAWNLDHATQHGVSPSEAESIVRHGRPRNIGGGKLKTIGRNNGGEWTQVIYLIDPDGTIFVIHARPLTNREKVRARRNKP